MTSEYIENTENPFILYANFLEPHTPNTSSLDEYYSLEDIPLPESFDCEPDETFPYKIAGFSKSYQAQLPSEKDWKTYIRNYWGEVTLVDRQVGKILDALERSGKMDDTIIIFTSDHGDMAGSHKLCAKCVMYEEAVAVPLIINLPGQRENVTHNTRVGHIDLLPTIIEAMGRPAYPQCQGQSLYPCLCGGDEPRHDVIVEWNGSNKGLGDYLNKGPVPSGLDVDTERFEASATDPVRTIITPDGWKYSRSTIGEHVLVNLNDDPYEKINLYGRSEYDTVTSDLNSRIQRWQEQTGDIIK